MAEHMRTNGGKVVWYGTELQLKYRRNMLAFMDNLGRDLMQAVRRNISIPCDGTNHSQPFDFPKLETGRLWRSIYYKTQGYGEPSVKVGFTEPHGMIMEFGSMGGQMIYPKNGSVLSWVDATGVRRYARSVRRGTIVPRPFLKPTLMQEMPKIQNALRGVNWLS